MNTATKWNDLIVSTGDTAEGSTLGNLIETDDTSLLQVQIKDGAIVAWPQLYISAPGEAPDYNTPVAPVDWSGFESALQTVRENLGA